MGTVITNLDNIVTTAIGDQISTHVNIVAANQAITDANAAVVTATDKADIATAQAAIATSKAAEADASADAAGASEIAAATSASEAQAEMLLALDYRNDAFDYLNATLLKYDEFDDRYLGAYDDDPRTDNDGRALIEGALYWNMLDKRMLVFTGAVWIGISNASGGLLVTQNLADLTDKALARDNLGVYSKAYIDVITGQAYTFDGNKEFSGNVTIQGDLVVNGATTTVDAENVTIKDNILTLNAGETGAGVTLGSSGILIDRGTATDYEFKFDEADDSFKIGLVGDLQKVATREDTPIDGAYARWDAATNKFVTVLLNNTLTSTSTTEALTAAQGKVLQDSKEPANANIQAHIATIGNPHGTVAGEVGVTPKGNLSSTTVQLALEELQGDINSLLVDIEWLSGVPTGTGGGTPNGNLSCSEVQSALVELQIYIDLLLVDVEW